VLYDLDIIVRGYLLPGIVPSFGTVSDHRWKIEFDKLRQRDPKLAAAKGDMNQVDKNIRRWSDERSGDSRHPWRRIR
jgi:hypothetical protein